MKKSMKVISILMVVLMIISVVSPVFATTFKPEMGAISQSGANTMLNNVLGAIKYIGIFAAVAIMMIIGIKYMMGSAEEKAEYKKVFIPYIIGIVLLLAASVIVGIIQDMVVKTAGEEKGVTASAVQTVDTKLA